MVFTQTKQIFFGATVLSVMVHALFGAGTRLLPDVSSHQNKVLSINVTTLPKVPTPVPAATVAPTPVPTVAPKPTPKPEEVVVEKKKPNLPRVDKSVPKSNEPPPPEQAGVSESSLAKPGTGVGGTSAAVGNSATQEVVPEQANLPPPKPYNPIEDPNANPVVETVADEEAKCSRPIGLQNTEDAINAGLTTAKLEVEIFVNALGDVVSAVLTKKTGFEIDKIVLAEAKKMRCSPAKVGGKPVAVKQKVIKFEIRE